MAQRAVGERHKSRGRGFASMDREKQREIARRGGRAAHEQGTAHEWTSDEARVAGPQRWLDEPQITNPRMRIAQLSCKALV